MAQTMRLYLVRHGEAEHNVLGVGSSLPEITERHLTEWGKEQIRLVAESLRDKHIAAIVSSPILRTRETAAIISEVIGVPVDIDDRLHETNLGIFNEKPIRLFFDKYPNPEMRISPDGKDGVESFIDMRGRLERFLDDLKWHHAGENVVIVSHGDPLEQLHGILTHESPGIASTGWYPTKGSCTEMTWNQG
ncbi:MAG: histidine phosphatase family protein [Candidatus Moranbacteria bacterium]|nr:histidine phosphatase family protein [Candidatus Moranbacteria bacterium]